MKIELEKVLEYQIWANNQLREIVNSLSEEEFVLELDKQISMSNTHDIS